MNGNDATNPAQSQPPFDEERPTEPLWQGERFDATLGSGQGDTFAAAGEPTEIHQALWEHSSDAWLRQTGPTRVVNSQPPGGSGVIIGAGSAANGSPPRGQAPRRGGPRVSRRTLLVGAGIAGLGAVAAAAGIGIHSLTSSSAVTPGSNQQIAHLLRRAGFGAAPGEIETYSTLGITGAVDRLLNFQNIPNTVMDQRIAAANFDFSKAQDTLNWWLARMVYTTHPLEEKMTLFWHGLLTSSFRKVGGQRGFQFLKQNNDFLRQHAFARFDDILAGITIDPAMLIWLDGNNSRVGAPNENFAREEMELFSMGVGNYTQTDIEQSARALTGWRVNPLLGKAVFAPRLHDNGQKSFLGQTGNFDYKDIARIICAQAVTPKFLAARLWRFFAYENPGAADLQPLVDAYHNHDHSVGAMMQALLTSPAFYSPQAYRARIKGPIEFVAGAFRNLGLGGIEQARATILGALEVMGQAPYDPPNVAGWPGDQISGNWINTGAWMTRVNVVNALVVYMNRSPNFMQGLQATVQKQQISTPDGFVDYVLVQLIDGQLDSARRQMLIDYLNSGNSGGGGVTLAGGKSLSGESVRGLYYLVMSMPEYQLD